MPVEQIDLNSDTPIIFRHPDINRQLIVGTGVSGISWSYNLNTAPTSTYGGEVVQVLSAYVDAITVHGQTSSNRQLRQIADWFLEYMQLAGLHNRDEHFITMEYPERGWSFWIQVTQLPDFHYNRDEIAVEWSITAEIVADNDLNYLSQMTMTAYTETAFDPSMWDMKFMAHDPRNDPIHLDPALGLKIGDNFQSLLGAWATGDFAHWAFDATSNVAKNHLKNSREYWSQIYGSDTPFTMNGQSGSGSATYGSFAGSGLIGIAASIDQAANSAGIPGYIMVASSLVETGGSLDPNDRQKGGDNAMGLFQSFPNGRAGSQSHASEVRQAFDHPNDPVTKYWPTAHQIEDAVNWWKPYLPVTGDKGAWAKRAQGAGDSAYASKVDANIPRAQQLIAESKLAATSGSGGYGALVIGGLSFVGNDQGIDFTGQGALRAVADGIITFVSTNSGWPGGGLVCLKLAHPINRPAINITATHVYYAEAIHPQVRPGQRMVKGNLIATMDSSYPGTEVGWARNDAGQAYGATTDGHGGATPIYGIDFGNYVKSL